MTLSEARKRSASFLELTLYLLARLTLTLMFSFCYLLVVLNKSILKRKFKLSYIKLCVVISILLKIFKKWAVLSENDSVLVKISANVLNVTFLGSMTLATWFCLYCRNRVKLICIGSK